MMAELTPNRKTEKYKDSDVPFTENDLLKQLMILNHPIKSVIVTIWVSDQLPNNPYVQQSILEPDIYSVNKIYTKPHCHCCCHTVLSLTCIK